jgi:hypothetical protein
MVRPFDEFERMAAIDREDRNEDLNPEMDVKDNKPYYDPFDDLDSDLVNNPPHYNAAGIECIDAMEAMVQGANVPAHESYCWQNAFKYLWRFPYKNGLEDLQKARWYIDRLISHLERKQ